MKLFSATLALLVLSTSAYATGKNEQPVFNSKGGNATAVGIGIGKGGNATNRTNVDVSNRNRNVNTITSRNTNRQRQTQSQGQSQRAYANNQGVSQSVYTPRDRLQAPGISAAFSSSTCSPYGLGVTFPGAGGLLQFPDNNGTCPDVQVAEMLLRMGCHNAAAAILADVPRNQAIRDNPCYGPSAVRTRNVVRAKY